MAVAVLRERPRLAAGVAADPAGVRGSLVDVVADEHHQVEVLGGQVAVRGVVALLEVLARAEPEPQPLRASRRPPGAVRVRPTGLTSPPAMKR